jgi:hypothetical protein
MAATIGRRSAMPLFYFHLETPEEWSRGDHGIELPSAEAAYLEAYRALNDTMVEVVTQGHDPARCALHVTDDAGELHWVVPILERVPNLPKPRPVVRQKPSASDAMRERMEAAFRENRRQRDVLQEIHSAAIVRASRTLQLLTECDRYRHSLLHSSASAEDPSP